MLYLFEISKKWLFRKGLGLGGGVGGDIFEIRGGTFGRSGACSNKRSSLVWFVYSVSWCLARCSNMSLIWQISVP